MKALFLFIALVISGSAFAATKAKVYCKVEGKIYNAQSEQGHFECAAALMDGSACFTGSREDVIEQINNREFDWDEEWLGEASYRGRNAVTYYWVDGPNDLKEELVLNRCTNRFFNGRE